MRKIINPALPIIKKNWSGNPLDENGKYKNIDGPSERGFRALFRWQLSSNKYQEKKKGQSSNVKVHDDSKFLSDKSNGFTWLGHATFLYEWNGKRFLTDPILGNIWPLNRYTPLPCNAADLNVDYILLSHNHRDHCDQESMTKICQQNPQAIIITGLGIGSLLRKWKIKNQIIEAGWFQEYVDIDGVKISYLPAKHWSRRYLWDLNEMLWGSFMIQVNQKNIYFGADSGKGDHFAMIKTLFGDIDWAFLGIGAYEPTWFMKYSHTSPSDVLDVQKILNAKKVIPMHYGTFDLSDEPIFLPKNKIQKLTEKRKDFLIADIGKKYELT